MPLGTVVELEADDAARQAITAVAPLTLHLDWPVDEGTERVIAVAYADGLFYPVGHSDADTQTVAITWLPSSEEAAQMGEGGSEGQGADEALVMRRSVGRVLKLYLYKMVGWQAPTLGLHRVRYVEPAEIARIELAPGEFLREFAGGALLYGPIDADAILPRQRVAVAVHGFSADSLAIGIWLTNVFPKHGPAYDHVLAFDYESLATGVNENASTLADALRALELDVRPRVRVDLFAHSMGTLVTRAFVELWGGDAFVTRCFLAGPPNQGTRLADAKVLVPWLTSLALNSVGGWTPAAIAQWALGKIEADAAGVEDLRPSSPLLTALNQSTKAVSVSYFVLAGHNPLLPQLDETLLERLQRHLLQGVDLALDTIFDDQNDMVINVRSMLGVRDGNYPAHLLQQAEVPCNHFTYFSDAAAQAQLLRWLQ
jgi:pimeloyl-ACP methyl ester carboxylesterase